MRHFGIILILIISSLVYPNSIHYLYSMPPPPPDPTPIGGGIITLILAGLFLGGYKLYKTRKK